MSTTSTLELLHLDYQAQQALLIGRWGYQPARAELAATYDRLYKIALRCRARRWLQDFRLRTLPDPDTMQWLFTEFYPDLARQLGGLRVAYLVGPKLRGLMEAGPDLQPLFSRAGKPFVVNFFGEEPEALNWLIED